MAKKRRKSAHRILLLHDKVLVVPAEVDGARAHGGVGAAWRGFGGRKCGEGEVVLTNGGMAYDQLCAAAARHGLARTADERQEARDEGRERHEQQYDGCFA